MNKETSTKEDERKRLYIGLGVGIALFTLGWNILDALTHPTRPRYSVGPALPAGQVPPQLAGHHDLAVFLSPEGTLWAWGGARLGGLFSVAGKTTPALTPVRLGTNSNWLKVAANAHAIYGIKQDGTLWGLGWNGNSRLPGLARGARTHTEIRLSADTNWIEVVAGTAHGLALKRNGTLWAWGSNWAGQTGTGQTNREVGSITQVGASDDWISVTTIGITCYGMRRDRSIWHWGQDTFRHTPGHTFPALLDGATNWVSIAAGWDFTLGLKDDGTLWIHGNSARAIASGHISTTAHGFEKLGTDRDWISLVAGPLHFLVRKRDGSWWTCGSNESGQLGLNYSSTDFFDPRDAKLQPVRFPLESKSVVALNRTTLALGPDGAIWSWGLNLGTPANTNLWGKFVNLINRGADAAGIGRILKPAETFRIDVQPWQVSQWPFTNTP